MDIQKKRQEFELLPDIRGIIQDGFQFNSELNQYFHLDHVNHRLSYAFIMGAWQAWLAADAQAVPEGFVLVLKSKINTLYQDSDEPENFCSSKDDFDLLGDCIDGDEIMAVDIHESVQIGTKKAFGVWRSKSPIDIESEFVLIESREEAEQILIANRAMLEAQEQGHD